MNPLSVLVADDDGAFRHAMGKALGRIGFLVREASSGAEAIAQLREGASDVALLDLQLGDLDGLTVLRSSRGTRTRIIVVTGHGTIATAVEAMRLGAASFVQKPIDAQALAPMLQDAALAEPPPEDLGLAGGSPELERVRAFIRKAAPTDETVLITGESGVGKELVARGLHAQSRRADGPFVALNCAQAHRELFDAELFGYVRGAFTGAQQDRSGLFREAHLGTLFLDELGELPVSAQAKLLRALETRTIRPVGSNKEEAIDVRVVAATNRNLQQEVASGRFRSDLLYRLHVLAVEIPPLRERTEDLAPIALFLMERFSLRHGRAVTVSEEALLELARYDWPGNVRELSNVLKRAALLSEGDRLTSAELRAAIASSIYGHPEARSGIAEAGAGGAELTLAELERRHVLDTFERQGNNVTRTAQALGIDRRTLQRKLKQLGRDPGDD